MVVNKTLGVDIREEMTLRQAVNIGWHVTTVAFLGAFFPYVVQVERFVFGVLHIMTATAKLRTRQTGQVLFHAVRSESFVRTCIATAIGVTSVTIDPVGPVVIAQQRFGRRC